MDLEKALRGVGVKWIENVAAYRVRQSRRFAQACDPGFAARDFGSWIADGECMLARQRREKADYDSQAQAGRARGANPVRRG